MVFSAFRHLPQYSTGSTSLPQAAAPVPPIRSWQETIEQAWREGELATAPYLISQRHGMDTTPCERVLTGAYVAGYDPAGAEHFRGKLIGSRRWIGTTEVYTALTYMGVKCVLPRSLPLVFSSTHSDPLRSAFIVDFPKQEPESGVVTNKALVVRLALAPSLPVAYVLACRNGSSTTSAHPPHLPRPPPPHNPHRPTPSPSSPPRKAPQST